MEFIKWTDGTSVGVPVIDAEHRQLADLINRVYGAIKDRRPLDMLRPSLDELEAYAEQHFATEERLMRTHGVPVLAYDFHMEEHDNFRSHLASLRRDLEVDPSTLRVDLWELVGKWWDKHVLGTDKQLARAIKSNAP